MFTRRLVQKIASPSACRQVGYSKSTQVGARSFSAAAQESPVSDLSASYIELEDKYGAHNYHPLPVVLTKGEGELHNIHINLPFAVTVQN